MGLWCFGVKNRGVYYITELPDGSRPEDIVERFQEILAANFEALRPPDGELGMGLVHQVPAYVCATMPADMMNRVLTREDLVAYIDSDGKAS